MAGMVFDSLSTVVKGFKIMSYQNKINIKCIVVSRRSNPQVGPNS